MVSLDTLASVVMMASHAILISLASQAGQANLVCIACLDSPFIYSGPGIIARFDILVRLVCV